VGRDYFGVSVGAGAGAGAGIGAGSSAFGGTGAGSSFGGVTGAGSGAGGGVTGAGSGAGGGGVTGSRGWGAGTGGSSGGGAVSTFFDGSGGVVVVPAEDGSPQDASAAPRNAARATRDQRDSNRLLIATSFHACRPRDRRAGNRAREGRDELADPDRRRLRSEPTTVPVRGSAGGALRRAARPGAGELPTGPWEIADKVEDYFAVPSSLSLSFQPGCVACHQWLHEPHSFTVNFCPVISWRTCVVSRRVAGTFTA
jgi:hypothetical protein